MIPERLPCTCAPGVVCRACQGYTPKRGGDGKHAKLVKRSITPYWTHERVVEAVRVYMEAHGGNFPRYDDFVNVNGLPSKSVIKMRYGKLNVLKERMGVPLGFHGQGGARRSPTVWTKEAIIKAFQRKSSPPVNDDLVKANGLPSPDAVRRQFPTLADAREAAGFPAGTRLVPRDYWTKEKVIEALQAFRQREGHIPLKRHFLGVYGLPSWWVIKDLFGSLMAARESAGLGRGPEPGPQWKIPRRKD